METRYLIVNVNGVFSALPSPEEFNSGAYLTNPDQFLTYVIQIAPVDLNEIHALRDNLMVIGPDLPLKYPEQIEFTDHHYVRLVPYGSDWSLQRVEIPEMALFTQAKTAKYNELMGLMNPIFDTVTATIEGEERTYETRLVEPLRAFHLPQDQKTGIICRVGDQPHQLVEHTTADVEAVLKANQDQLVKHHEVLQNRWLAYHQAATRHDLSFV